MRNSQFLDIILSMADFAIVEIAGKQYKAVAGQELVVDKLAQDIGAVTLDKVLMIVQDGAVKIGTPYVSRVSVAAKVIAQEKGDKIYVVKFKAKSRYRRRTGFRAQQTRILVEKIVTDTKTNEASKSASKAPQKIKRSTK